MSPLSALPQPTRCWPMPNGHSVFTPLRSLGIEQHQVLPHALLIPSVEFLVGSWFHHRVLPSLPSTSYSWVTPIEHGVKVTLGRLTPPGAVSRTDHGDEI